MYFAPIYSGLMLVHGEMDIKFVDMQYERFMNSLPCLVEKREKYL